MKKLKKSDVCFLKTKACALKAEVLKIHKSAPETRIASCLSNIEIFSVLFYGKLLHHIFADESDIHRDRLIISKGHGSFALYPILKDFGFLSQGDLASICKDGSSFGSIPDCSIPGVEFITGSLGLGLGVACGVALALKRRQSKAKVFVLMGDGELYEGSVWEAVMFASEHKLDNLILVVDNNKICMLDYCAKVIDMTPLNKKFESFRWQVTRVDGHNVSRLWESLKKMKSSAKGRPQVLIADTVKGKGVSRLEKDSLCHIKSLAAGEVDEILGRLK